MPTAMPIGRILRITAAIAILISGIVHLDLYFNQGYRFASSDVNFGRSIALNAIGAGVIAVALVARSERILRLLGIGYAVSTIGAFWYTHAGNSFLGFEHGGPAFDPSPQAQLTVIMGIIAILALAAMFVPAVEASDEPMGLPSAGIALGVAAVALIGLTIKWQPEDGTTETAAPTTTVAAATDASTAPDASTGPDATTAPDASADVPAAGGDAVSIKDFAFDAADVTVAKGTTITWTNNDSAKHSVVAEDTSFISDNLAQGQTFEHTFDADGTFAYICGIHPQMKGTITVSG